jgi:NAD(P)-dependent dehydrogenase (short-subunit alcohol dehydrogenase family)
MCGGSGLADAGTTRLLDGKVALITGGGRGIGAWIAGAFGEQGARLALVSRTVAELERTTTELAERGASAHAFPGDISEPEDVQRIVERCLEVFGRIDILVNNAGVQTPIGPSWQIEADVWLRTVAINLGGVYLCSRAVIPAMIEQGGGKVINMSGAGGGALPYFSAYSASKAAVGRLTETMAAELEEHNIQVNAIAPGAVRTRMTDDVLQAGARAGSKQLLDAHRIDVEHPTPERAAELALFLASDASGKVTGRLLSAIWDDWQSLPLRWPELVHSDLFTLRRVAE